MMCGGSTDVQKATCEIQTMCEQVKKDVETKAEKQFAMYTAIEYKSQVVAGTNYFVKICVGDSDYVHVRIFKPLPHTEKEPELHSFQDGKTSSDELVYF